MEAVAVIVQVAGLWLRRSRSRSDAADHLADQGFLREVVDLALAHKGPRPVLAVTSPDGKRHLIYGHHLRTKEARPLFAEVYEELRVLDDQHVVGRPVRDEPFIARLAEAYRRRGIAVPSNEELLGDVQALREARTLRSSASGAKRDEGVEKAIPILLARRGYEGDSAMRYITPEKDQEVREKLRARRFISFEDLIEPLSAVVDGRPRHVSWKAVRLIAKELGYHGLLREDRSRHVRDSVAEPIPKRPRRRIEP